MNWSSQNGKAGRIVMVLSAFPKLSETFIVNKFVELLKNGWDVHVVCSKTERAEWAKVRGLKDSRAIRRRVHVTWPVRPRWLACVLMPVLVLRIFIQAPKSLARFLTKGWGRFGFDTLRRLYLDSEFVLLAPDLLHFEFGALAVDRMHLKELLLVKSVVSFRGHDINFVGLEDPDHYSEVWEHVDGVHCLGSALWDRARQRGCPASIPHALISPAVDCDYFRATPRQRFDLAGNDENPLRVLMVGRLAWSKGYEYALQALGILREKGVSFECRIIGGGKSLEAVAFCRHQMGLEHQVRLLGDQCREVVREQMAWADVFLHAAVEEGFCNAVIEAQAMELPVVSADAGGLSENIADAETGFVVSRRDPEALAEKLAILARDPVLRQKMGEAGRRRVLKRYRLSDQTDAFDRLYHSVLSGDLPKAKERHPHKADEVVSKPGP